MYNNLLSITERREKKFQLFYTMSNEIEKKSEKRSYKLKKRAKRQAEVHRRITLAAVHLHRTVGPARTTMNAIAEHAGVRRATVYNHFPTDYELIDACSSHWMTENPPPDISAWAEISDPQKRALKAFEEMYDYFEREQEMLGHVLRDTHLIEALEKIVQQKWEPFIEQIVSILNNGWTNTDDDSVIKKINATLRVALNFFTWQNLRTSGLSNKEAAAQVVQWVEGVTV